MLYFINFIIYYNFKHRMFWAFLMFSRDQVQVNEVVFLPWNPSYSREFSHFSLMSLNVFYLEKKKRIGVWDSTVVSNLPGLWPQSNPLDPHGENQACCLLTTTCVLWYMCSTPTSPWYWDSNQPAILCSRTPCRSLHPQSTPSKGNYCSSWKLLPQ